MWDDHNRDEQDRLLEGGAPENPPPAEDKPEDNKDNENDPKKEEEEKKEPDVSSEHITRREKYNYSFMDGIRGIGAFSVYCNHFMLTFYPYYSKSELEDGKEKYYPPEWVRTTPIRIFYGGHIWVLIFFILSGFVLPMNYFKTMRLVSITGGTFRRYLRLMLPVLFIYSVIYMFMRFDAYGEDAFKNVNKKQSWDVILDGLFGTWMAADGQTDTWISPTWTLSIELIATFWIYLLAQTVRAYEKRYWLYIFVIFPLLLVHTLEAIKLVPWTLSRIFIHLPHFFIGVGLCDMEFLEEWRPLDAVRFKGSDAVSWILCIVRNLILMFIFFSYGMVDRYGCLYDISADDRCPYVYAILFNDSIPFWWGTYFASFAMIALVLLSGWLQWFMMTPPMQFMGRISYMLYLSHEIFVEWGMIDFYGHFRPMVGKRMDGDDDTGLIPHDAMVGYCFLLFTPILLLVAWLLTLAVDDPSKDFSYELDVQNRVMAPKKDEDGNEYIPEDTREPTWLWLLKSWKMWVLFGWLVLVFTVCEIYDAAHGRPERYNHEGFHIAPRPDKVFDFGNYNHPNDHTHHSAKYFSPHP